MLPLVIGAKLLELPAVQQRAVSAERACCDLPLRARFHDVTDLLLLPTDLIAAFHWFESLTDAQQKIEAWRQDYNCVSYYPTNLRG